MRRRVLVIVIALLLVGWDMSLHRRLLIAGSGASATPSSLGSTRHALFNGQNGDGEYKIFAATYDGSSWSEYGSNPVLVKGSGGAWDDDHVKDPALLHDGSQYIAFYAGHDGSKYQIGVATASSHEGPWTKYGSNPVLAVGSGGSFDDSGVNFPAVLHEPWDAGREWKLWYGANEGSTQTIGYAYSSSHEGPFTKVGEVLSLGSSGTWDDVGHLPMAALKLGPTYHLFFGGRQNSSNPRWQGGLATFTDPEGIYTKDASNPILLARFNDGSTSQTPTADVTAGGTTVSLPDASVFHLGEPVTLADGDTTAEHFYLTNIAGNVVTLDHAVVGNFTGGGKVFRSFAFNSVLPRSVIRLADGTYEMFGTPFQPVDDLTQPASKLWEGSFRWTASAPDDVWAYDYVPGRGLLFPLSPTGAAWHSRSAENPSVIVTP